MEVLKQGLCSIQIKKASRSLGIALHLREDVAFYFDSFGFPLIEDDIFKFIKDIL